MGGAEHITELEQIVRCEIADRWTEQPLALPSWLPSDVTDSDLKRCLRLIEHLPKEGLQFVSDVQAGLRQLIKGGTPTYIVVSTLLGGYARTFFWLVSSEKDQLIMLAILEERVRAGIRAGGRISFGKAPELVVDLGLMTDASINAVEAELAVRIAGMERFIRSGASFDHDPKQAVFVESHSSTEIDIAGREEARAALRGYTEDTADLVSDRDYSEAAHLKAVQAAAEILYNCRARDAIKQHGELAFPRLADPIARDVVLDLCRLRVLAIPYGAIRRTRASVGRTGRPDDQTQSLMQQDLDNALRGKPGMQIEVRKWAEPTLLKLVAKYRSTALPESRDQMAEGDMFEGEARVSAPSGDDSPRVSAEPEVAESGSLRERHLATQAVTIQRLARRAHLAQTAIINELDGKIADRTVRRHWNGETGMSTANLTNWRKLFNLSKDEWNCEMEISREEIDG